VAVLCFVPSLLPSISDGADILFSISFSFLPHPRFSAGLARRVIVLDLVWSDLKKTDHDAGWFRGCPCRWWVDGRHYLMSKYF